MSTGEAVEEVDDECGPWIQDRRTGRRFVGGGHLDPDECDRFERVLLDTWGDMTPAEADQWARGSRRRTRK